MKIIYSPNYTNIQDCPTEFVHYLASKLSHYIEREQLLLFINSVGKSFPFSSEYAFKAKLNSQQLFNVRIYSGFLKNILLDIYAGNTCISKGDFTLQSTVDKYVCKDSSISDVLRPHQKRIVEACLSHKRGIVKSPTGSGKSFCISELVRKFKKQNLKVLVSVPTIDLLHQLTENIQDYFKMNGEDAPVIGKVGDGNFDYQDITVGIPNSLCKTHKTAEFLSSVDVLLADECHMTANATYASIIDCCTNIKVAVGLSATPTIEDGSNILLEAFFGPRIIEIHESEMIDSNVIMEPYFHYYPAPAGFISSTLGEKAANISMLKDGERYKILQVVYDTLIINNKGRNALIVQKAIERIRLNVGPIIIIVNKVKGSSSHADVLKKLLDNNGFDLPIVSGYISKKKKEGILNDLKESKIDGVIAGPKILSTGISIPSLSTIILAGAGRSNNEFIQRVGRLLRKKEGKERPLVIDFMDSQFWFKSQSYSRKEIAEDIYGSHNVIIK